MSVKLWKSKGRVLWVVLAVLSLAVPVMPQLVSADSTGKDRKQISTEEFMQGPFGELFNAGEYDRALDVLNDYLREYPKDPLLRRYQAMTYDQLGQHKKALPVFQDLLSEDPAHAPTHYFLAQSYYLSGQFDKAREEWIWVVENAKGTPYAQWAADSLSDIREMKQAVSAADKRIKKWRISAYYGYEFDDNVILTPDDNSLSSGRDEDAGRHSLGADLRYRAYSKRDLAVDLEYGVSQSFHDDSLNEFNFHSEDFGVNARKRVRMFERDVTFGARYEFSMGFLEEDLFSLRNRFEVSADTRLSKHTRTVLSDRISISNFGPDGFNPPQTSRDGIYNDVSLTQYWFAENFKRFVFVRQEINNGQTDGFNFDYFGTTTRVGIHTPIVRELMLDTSAGFQFRDYYNFESLSSRDLSGRRNSNWDIYAALSYPLAKNVRIRGIYRYIQANNRNNFFDYTRHIFGGEVRFTELF